MKMMICRFILLLICGASFSYADDLLKKEDIHKVMHQIFKQHVDKKAMSTTILKNALRNYIEQFDPQRIYLLEEEVRPYLQPTDDEMQQMLDQYKQDDLSAYIQLNIIIQHSIQRARGIRKEIELNPSHLFQKNSWKEESTQFHEFARSIQDLKKRIQDNMIEFIQEESARFGAVTIMRDEKKTLSVYEKKMKHTENQYLATNEAGNPLSPSEQENLFVLHVLKALASSFDAHTKVLNNSEAYDMKMRLEKQYTGIGVILKKRGSYVIIAGLVEGSSAAKKGEVHINDRVIEIDGRPIADEPFDRVLDKIRDEKSPTMTLTLSRDIEENHETVKKQIIVQLKRETLAINEGRVESSFVPYDNGIIGRISLHAFYQGANGISSENDVQEAIKKLKTQGNLRGLVLDLRDNGGGFLIQAVKVGGLFIKSGIIVISKYSNGEEHFYRDIDGTTTFDGPLVVLTSRETASAAEIVTQALQDYGVAIVVGDDHTYGKGTIQSQTVTDNGSTSFFKVTVGKYYTVSGKTPQLLGVTSDIVVPSFFEREPVGEEYLDDAVASDKIASSYGDQMKDVETELKPWYLRYYAPNMQHKKDLWRSMLPTLKKNSENRIAHNKNYQIFIREMNGTDTNESKPKGAWLFPEHDSKDPVEEDLQLTEATNIVKDMITMQSKIRASNE